MKEIAVETLDDGRSALDEETIMDASKKDHLVKRIIRHLETPMNSAIIENRITDIQRDFIRYRLSMRGIVRILHEEPSGDMMREASLDVIRQELNKHSSLLERLFGDLSEYYVPPDRYLPVA